MPMERITVDNPFGSPVALMLEEITVAAPTGPRQLTPGRKTHSDLLCAIVNPT
jgi:hypothetical protein